MYEKKNPSYWDLNGVLPKLLYSLSQQKKIEVINYSFYLAKLHIKIVFIDVSTRIILYVLKVQCYESAGINS